MKLLPARHNQWILLMHWPVDASIKLMEQLTVASRINIWCETFFAHAVHVHEYSSEIVLLLLVLWIASKWLIMYWWPQIYTMLCAQVKRIKGHKTKRLWCLTVSDIIFSHIWLYDSSCCITDLQTQWINASVPQLGEVIFRNWYGLIINQMRSVGWDTLKQKTVSQCSWRLIVEQIEHIFYNFNLARSLVGRVA